MLTPKETSALILKRELQFCMDIEDHEVTEFLSEMYGVAYTDEQVKETQRHYHLFLDRMGRIVQKYLQTRVLPPMKPLEDEVMEINFDEFVLPS